MKALWDEFNELGTEMIVTKAGRSVSFAQNKSNQLKSKKNVSKRNKTIWVVPLQADVPDASGAPIRTRRQFGLHAHDGLCASG
jgi:hypothetical protein